MAIDENNIISAPVSLAEVESVLGSTNLSVYDAWLSNNVNKWSRYKPIFVSFDSTGIDFYFRGNGYSDEFAGLTRFGFVSWSAFASHMVASNGTLNSYNDWSYSRLKLASIPRRLSDFDGYYHDAQAPFGAFFIPPELGTYTSGSSQQAYLTEAIRADVDGLDESEPGSILMSQIKAPTLVGSEDVSLNKMFFGVALISRSGTPTVKWAKSEQALLNTSGEITHVWSVNMDVSDMTAGDYWAVPILTRSKVGSVSSTPTQICLVPDCVPVAVTIKSGSTDVYAIKAAWVTRQVVFLSDATDDSTGDAVVTANVVNSGTTAISCNYKFYTIQNGSTTQEHIQTGKISLSAGGTSILRANSFTVTKVEVQTMMVYLEISWYDGTANRTTTISTTLRVMESNI